MYNKFRNVIYGLRYRAAMARLSRPSQMILKDHLTYLSPEKLGRIEKSLRRVLLNNVSGDVLEFGVALGGSAIVLAGIAGLAHRRFYGFDVFEMIPAPTSEKDDEKSKQRYNLIASGKSEGIGGDLYYGYRNNLLEEVMQSFAKYKLPIDNQNRFLCKGLFENTLPKYDGNISFAHIDCDWYDPVKFCLEEISKRLLPGGEIVLDDYHDYGGARSAVDEFVKREPNFQFIDGPNVILQMR
jgi:O-methyltransferase